MTERPDGSDMMAGVAGARRHAEAMVAGVRKRFGPVGATFCAPSAEREISTHIASKQQQAHQPPSTHRPFAQQDPAVSTSPMGQTAHLLLPCRRAHGSPFSGLVTEFASQFKYRAAVDDRVGRASWSWLTLEASSSSVTAEATSSDGSE